jgi:hypothetical protein
MKKSRKVIHIFHGLMDSVAFAEFCKGHEFEIWRGKWYPNPMYEKDRNEMAKVKTYTLDELRSKIAFLNETPKEQRHNIWHIEMAAFKTAEKRLLHQLEIAGKIKDITKG